MRLRLSFTLMTAGFLALTITTASAQWCARMQGGESCGFSTLAQCRATVSGVGGSCFPNPRSPAYGADPGLAAARNARVEQMKRWRKTIQEQRAERRKELARERQRRATPSQARPAAPAAALGAAAPGIPVTDLDTNAVPNLSRDGFRRVQQVLKEKGFDPGPLTGVPGPRLKDAVRRFQSRYGIAPRGDIDNQTLLALGEAALASQSNR